MEKRLKTVNDSKMPHLGKLHPISPHETAIIRPLTRGMPILKYHIKYIIFGLKEN
jgi:hypothetical protein